MNAIKHIVITGVALVFTCLLLLYSSCGKPNQCGEVGCRNGGVCKDNICICPTGFEGTHCETVSDPCLGFACQHGGTCNLGICTCPVGYEGVHCETRSRDKFIGTYRGHEQCGSGTDNYSISLGFITDELGLQMTNVFAFGFTATCTMIAADTFLFIGSEADFTYNGKGALKDTVITINYSVTSSSGSNTCTFTGVKQ